MFPFEMILHLEKEKTKESVPESFEVADNVTIPQIIKCISYEKECYFTQQQNTLLCQEFNTDTLLPLKFNFSQLSNNVLYKVCTLSRMCFHLVGIYLFLI